MLNAGIKISQLQLRWISPSFCVVLIHTFYHTNLRLLCFCHCDNKTPFVCDGKTWNENVTTTPWIWEHEIQHNITNIYYNFISVKNLKYIHHMIWGKVKWPHNQTLLKRCFKSHLTKNIEDMSEGENLSSVLNYSLFINVVHCVWSKLMHHLDNRILCQICSLTLLPCHNMTISSKVVLLWNW